MSESARETVFATPSAEIGGGLRAAAQTRPESSLLRRGGGWIEDDVFRARRACGTDRTAIDPGRFDAREEAAAGVADGDCAVAGVVVEVHALIPICAR